MKKILSLLLVFALALSMAACGNNVDPTNPSEDPNTNTTTEDPNTNTTTEDPNTNTTTEDPNTNTTTEDPNNNTTTSAGLYMLMITFGDSYETADSITIYDNDMGGIFFDCTINGVRKSATLDVAVLADVATALTESNLLALDGASEWGDGTNVATLYVTYTDWTSVSADYNGVAVPEAFTTGYATLAAALEIILADVPVYVPQASVMGEMDEDLKNELLGLVNNAGLPNLDAIGITGIEMDEYFTYSAGLTSAEGVTAGAQAQNMMMGGAVYSLVMVKADNTDAVAADFEAALDWGKWVCVRPSNAIIAVKGNMVLCLMSSDAAYTGTVTAIENAGWTTVKALTNPEM